MRKTKEQGITLIALVITIIVLLILAGVALATLTGNTSIIDNANYAVTEYNKSANADQNVISDVENLFAKYMGNSQSSSGNSGETHRITYNANGGTGTMSEETAAVTGTSTFTPPEGKVFKEWNTSADGSGTSYTAGAAVPSDVTLYAIWVSENAEIIQQQYGNLVNEEDTINQNLFTWEVLTEAGTQKGTAKITGINWSYFGIEATQYRPYPGQEYWFTQLKITTLEKKQEVERTLRKLIVPYEVTKDVEGITKTYVITAIDNSDEKEWNYYGMLKEILDSEPTGYFSPILATGSDYDDEYQMLSGFSQAEDTSYLIIPASVTSIGELDLLPRDYIMFSPNNTISTIPEEMFTSYDIRYIKGIILPTTLTQIGEQAFTKCRWLKSISFDDNLTSLGAYAFSRCKRLIDIYIPKSVSLIGNGTFYIDSSEDGTIPTTIYYEGTEQEWAAITKGTKAFDGRTVTMVYESNGIPQN